MTATTESFGTEAISVYEELANFLANLSPRKVLAFKTSEKVQARVKYLLEKNRNKGLSNEEQSEMEKHMTVEHIIQLAKAKSLLTVIKK